MREKELRIALVFFGGVSLAVYIHGVSKEILKLVRASRTLHLAANDAASAAVRAEAGRDDPADPEYDTEEVWAELLQALGRTADLRVIVDVVAGASAGGINGVLLARALAHDLPIKAIRDLWLNRGDVETLLDPAARAGVWSKVFMRPFLWAAARLRRITDIRDPEVRWKLSLFMRSRWFKPPFSGSTMTRLMHEAVLSMGASRPSASLLPAGHRLDLFVTLTDFGGYRRSIEIHDPAIIDEREHERLLRFSYERHRGTGARSDFEIENAPGLAFAARATASFPGAFPPANLAEMDELLAAEGRSWPGRAVFLETAFDPPAMGDAEVEHTAFIDGSVLNDKPFREAIRAVHGRAAQREVDRRLVYIDPTPQPAHGNDAPRLPGFFATLRAALSDIPRNEPIANELDWMGEQNERVRRLRAIVDAARPQVTDLVSEVLPQDLGATLDAHQVGRWREAASARAAREAGFAYEAYVRLKLAAVRAQLAQTIARMIEIRPRTRTARFLADAIDAWAEVAGIGYVRSGSHGAGGDMSASGDMPKWVRFLLAFDVEYRKRRLHFLVQGQNRIRESLIHTGAPPAQRDAVNALKRQFHHQLDEQRRRETALYFSEETRALACDIFAGPASTAARDPSRRDGEAARAFVAGAAQRIDRLVARIGDELDLNRSTDEIDALLAAIDPALWPDRARREALVNHLGFPFWDVLALSVSNWRDAGEFDEILVDRMSPEDARTLKALGVPVALKGAGLMHFAAFFSRRYREHDYLMGRLQAADRLVDIVSHSAGVEACRGVDIEGLRRRILRRILDTEASHLPDSADLVDDLRRKLAAG
jgi:patatin-related protein